MIRNLIFVGLGGACGAIMRYGITLLFTMLQWSTTIGTFLTNIVGSFCIGLVTSCCQQHSWMLFLSVGMCGGFTTYSTFSMQSVTMLQQGRYGTAACYILGTATLCVAFAAAGYLLGQKMR